MSSKTINWAEYDEFLGQFPDGEIASLAGCSVSTVATRRKALNIDLQTGYYGAVNWDAVVDKLGKIPDYDVAKWYQREVGGKLSKSAVERYRKMHKIPSMDENMKVAEAPWDKTEDEILSSIKGVEKKVFIKYRHGEINKTIVADVPVSVPGNADYHAAVQGIVLKDLGIVWTVSDMTPRRCPFCREKGIEALNRGSEYFMRCRKCGAVGPTAKTKIEAMTLWGFDDEESV